MHWVTGVEYISGYKIQVRFEDDSEKIVDLKDHLHGPVFEPLRDPSFFRQAHLNEEIDTVVWPNDADFSPDFLYEIGKTV